MATKVVDMMGKEITQFHTNNKTRALQTSAPPLERNLLKQIEPKTEWWLLGVCWVNNFCKPIFRFLFVEITFNSHILTQIYESFCIILSLLPYDNRKYVSARGSFEWKNRFQLELFPKVKISKSNSAHSTSSMSIKLGTTPHSVKYCTVFSQFISLDSTFFKPDDSHSRA